MGRIFGISCCCFKGNSDRSRTRRLHWPSTFLPSPSLLPSGNIKNYCFSDCHGRFINTTYWNLFFYHIKVFLFLIFKALKHFHAALELLRDPGSVLTVSTEVSLEAGCLVSHDVCQNFWQRSTNIWHVFFKNPNLWYIYFKSALLFFEQWKEKLIYWLLEFASVTSTQRTLEAEMVALDEPTCPSLCSFVFSVTFSSREPCFCLSLNSMGNSF